MKIVTSNTLFMTIIAVVIMIATISTSEIVSADVGDVEICNSRTNFNLSGISISSNVEGAQTFTPSQTFTVSGIKLPAFHLDTQPDANISFFIVPTTLSGGKLRPDTTAGTLATVVMNTSEFPDISSVTETEQALVCSSASATGTVIEFGTPAELTGGTTYAIYVDAACGTACFRWGIPIQTAPTPNNYAGGQAYSNPSINNPAVPADWDDYCAGCVDGDSDSGFAIYSNVVTPVENDVTSWITNFLASMGMDSPVGRILVGSMFTMFFFLILAKWGVPWILSLGLTGLFTTFLTAAFIFDPAILLGLAALVMFGAMGLIFSLFFGGDKTNG